jgi:hypothetical protein
MRLGVMQPYFFPYLEQFRLIAACDMWMSRNRILNRDKGWSYLSVPVLHERGGMVAKTRLAGHLDWRGSLRKRLRVYEAHAPHYEETRRLVDEIVAADHQTLVDLDVAAISRICRLLGIATPIRRLSRLELDLPSECGPGEWALFIAEALGADEYRNPSGGEHLFDPAQFAAHGIELTFHRHIDIAYPTGPFPFVPDLSVLDTLMWLDRSSVQALLP